MCMWFMDQLPSWLGKMLRTLEECKETVPEVKCTFDGDRLHGLLTFEEEDAAI